MIRSFYKLEHSRPSRFPFYTKCPSLMLVMGGRRGSILKQGLSCRGPWLHSQHTAASGTALEQQEKKRTPGSLGKDVQGKGFSLWFGRVRHNLCNRRWLLLRAGSPKRSCHSNSSSSSSRLRGQKMDSP